MKAARRLTLATAAVAVLAVPALGQATRLRYDVSPGMRRVFQRTTRTETVVTAGGRTRRQVTETPARRDILVVETKDDSQGDPNGPAQMRIVSLETPAGRRLVVLEEDGEDRLAEVPEANRLRPMPPLLAAHWRDLTGRPTSEEPEPAQPMQVIERVVAELAYLPVDPVGPETPETRRVDLGIARATLTTRQVEKRAVGGARAVVLETEAAVAFTGEWADRISVKTLKARHAWAADGSGLLSATGTLVLDETADEADQHLKRTWETRLQEAGRLAPDALQKALANLEALEKAMADAREGNLDAAVKALKAYLEANPDGPWTPAVRNLQSALAQQKLLTQPVEPARLRLMLRDLQARRDRAGARGDRQRVAQIDQTLRQVARVNAKQILMDAVNPDPVARDLATFGLAFLDTPEAAGQLRTLAGGKSSRVRGTALVSLAIRREALEADTLLARLRDQEPRVRGAAALLAGRTLERGGARVAEFVPPLVEILEVQLPWARSNAAAALGRVAPKGSVQAVRGLVRAHEKEPEDALKQLYRAALEALTGLEAGDLEPYRKWLRGKGAAGE